MKNHQKKKDLTIKKNLQKKMMRKLMTMKMMNEKPKIYEYDVK